MSNITRIPYTGSDGVKSTAAMVPVEVSLEGLTHDDLQVVGHLASAMDTIAPIFAQQNYKDMIPLLRTVTELEALSTGEDRNRLSAFATILDIANSPFGHIGSLSYADDIFARHPISLASFEDVLAPGAKRNPKAGVYPTDMTDAEFDALPAELQMIENSTVVRDADGSLRVCVNEDRFSMELASARASLHAARPYARDQRLVNLIDAKISELRTGSKESRVNADIAWVKNQGKIDFIYSTALETYIDEYKSIRGCAQGGVFVVNQTYDTITQQLRDLIPQWRENAPWDRSKDGVSDIPQLRFVDVVRWGGGYDLFPGTVSAESLPNDTEVATKHGRVNLIFVNVQQAKAKGGSEGAEIAEFLPRDAQHLAPMLRPMYLRMVAAHELGHSIGPVVPEDDWKREFGADGHVLEEGRAEIFSQWSLPSMRRAGLITADEELAGHYEMVLTCVRALSRTPKNHDAARNMMIHRYLETGAVREIEEDGRKKYAIDMDRMKTTVTDFLAEFGTLKANLNGDGFRALKEQYCRTDRHEEFKERFSKFPTACGLIFPDLVRDEKGLFTGELRYPATFREQSRSLSRVL